MLFLYSEWISTEERLLVRKDLIFSRDIFLFVLRLDLFSALLEVYSEV